MFRHLVPEKLIRLPFAFALLVVLLGGCGKPSTGQTPEVINVGGATGAGAPAGDKRPANAPSHGTGNSGSVAESASGTATGAGGAAVANMADPESQRVYPLDTLQTTTVMANGHALKLWVMNDFLKREEGMMYLKDKDVADDQGMIFVFGSPAAQSFWMHNTLIGLDIIYVRADGTVANVVNAKPMDDTSLPSDGPALYVIELKAGMAKTYGIHKGTHLTIDKSLHSEDGNG